MSMFGNLSKEGVEETQDRLGGFNVLDTDAYKVIIKAAYVGKSTAGDSKARSVNLIVDTVNAAGVKTEFRTTQWVTNKADQNFYIDKNKKKQFLAGFTIIDDLCMVATGMSLTDPAMQTEDKVINVYDPEAKKELPKSVPMLVELLGKEAIFGILKQRVNKQVKGDNGYVDTAEEREENELDKIFHFPTTLTVPEARAGVTPEKASFYRMWVEKNRGVTRDKRSIKDGQGAVQSGRPSRPNGPPPGANGAAPKTASLFPTA